MSPRMLGTVLVVAVACAVPCVAGPAVNSGEWQVTVKTEMTGMPMQMPAQTATYTTCMTSEQPVPRPQQKHEECKVLDVSTEGNAVKWKIECSGKEGKMSGTGRIVYEGETFQGEQTMNMSMEGAGDMKVVNHMTGKRLGPCKETDKKK